MSKFNSYAKRLNEAAKTAFEKYKKAEKAYQAAEDRRRNMPWNATQEDKTLAEAGLIEARNNLKKAQETLSSVAVELKGIRGELAESLGRAFTANPEDIDPNTMELLRSGILTPAEYVKLANGAISSGNNTMLRLIGSYAEKYGNENREALSLDERGALYGVASRAKGSTGAAELGTFDNLVNTFERCANNPAMIDHWDELTQGTIEAF